jgi:hypothetical protein
MRIFGQPTRPSMSSRGGTSNPGGSAYRPMGVRNDPVTGAPILPGTQPPPWTFRPRPGTAAGGTPDRLPQPPPWTPRPRPGTAAGGTPDRLPKRPPRTSMTYANDGVIRLKELDSQRAAPLYARAMGEYLSSVAPHTQRYLSRYGDEATGSYIKAQVGDRPQMPDFMKFKPSYRQAYDLKNLFRGVGSGGAPRRLDYNALAELIGNDPERARMIRQSGLYGNFLQRTSR